LNRESYSAYFDLLPVSYLFWNYFSGCQTKLWGASLSQAPEFQGFTSDAPLSSATFCETNHTQPTTPHELKEFLKIRLSVIILFWKYVAGDSLFFLMALVHNPIGAEASVEFENPKGKLLSTNYCPTSMLHISYD
jgi:hypothetical protein